MRDPCLSNVRRVSEGLFELHSLPYRRRGSTQSFVVSFSDDQRFKGFGKAVPCFELNSSSDVDLKAYESDRVFFSSNSCVLKGSILILVLCANSWLSIGPGVTSLAQHSSPFLLLQFVTEVCS